VINFTFDIHENAFTSTQNALTLQLLRLGRSDGLPAGRALSSAITAEPIEMPFGLRTQVGPGNHVLDEGPDPLWEEAILRGGEGASHCRVWGHFAVICAKALSQSRCRLGLGLWARMGPSNRVLNGCPGVLRDVAMATNFGTTMAINGFA